MVGTTAGPLPSAATRTIRSLKLSAMKHPTTLKVLQLFVRNTSGRARHH
ncbi:hypothetical protein [Streptomyces sp. NPDC090021]